MSKYDNRDLTPDEVLKTLPDYIPKDQFARKLHDRRSKKRIGKYLFLLIINVYQPTNNLSCFNCRLPPSSIKRTAVNKCLITSVQKALGDAITKL